MKRKFMALLLTLAMVFSMFVPAMAEETAVTPYAIPDVKGKLVLIHTNDTHGSDVAVEGTTIGAAGVAQMKKDFEAAGATVLLVSAGDFSQGTTLVSLDKGASAVTFMNAAGYDIATLGNHEFDYKMDALKANVKAADFSIVTANLVDATTKQPLFGDNKVFETPVGKVGVFGLATPETMTKAHPDNVKGLNFYQGDELVKCAQAQVDALKKAGCTYIVALTHLGVSEESTPNCSTDVFAKVTGVNMVIDGHSHTEMAGATAKTVGTTTIVSSGEKTNNVGVVITDGKTATTALVSAAEYTKVDADVAKIVNDAAAKVAEEMGKVFGKTEILLNGERDPGNRTMETNLGNFATDALLWSARQTLGEDKVDAAITNGGGIRASIKAGDITMNDMKTVFPFGNTIVTIDVTGEQLLVALEAATCTTPTAIGAFPQVAGIEFVINAAVEYEKGEPYAASTYHAPAKPGSRVTIATVNDEPFDAKETYTIATNDFTAAGGDTYYVFKSAKNLTMTAVALEDALVSYTKDVLGGTITAEDYGTTEGRIRIIPADVKMGAWYTDAVHYVLAEGIMQGVGKGAFNPAGTVTRAEVYQMLFNMEGKPTDGIKKAAFNDIEGKWYSDAAHWAGFVGLTSGNADGSFGGDEVLTRAELASIWTTYGTLNQIVPDSSGMAIKEVADFDKIPAEYVSGMSYCLKTGIMVGNAAGEMLPAASVTRDQLAQMVFTYDMLTPAYTKTVVEIPVIAKNGIPAHTVVGTLTMPASATAEAKVPAVVMLHGTGSNRDEAGNGYIVAADSMALNGIATLRIDFMGTAADKVAEYVNYNYTSASGDAKAAADYLAKLTNVDGDKLGVMGWSQGGTNALLAAAKYPTTFKAVVTWAGATDLTTLFGDQAAFDAAYATAKKDGSFTMTLDWRTPSDLPVGVKWFEDVKNTDVLKETAKITGPVLAIQGEKDDVVAPANAAKIVGASKNADSATVLIPGGDHTFNIFSGNLDVVNTAIIKGSEFFLTQFGMTEVVAPAA